MICWLLVERWPEIYVRTCVHEYASGAQILTLAFHHPVVFHISLQRENNQNFVLGISVADVKHRSNCVMCST
jgi:hypothetical protein